MLAAQFLGRAVHHRRGGDGRGVPPLGPCAAPAGADPRRAARRALRRRPSSSRISTGLETTPATISGFITGMYVVLTPICAALLLKAHIGGRVWAGAALATVGLGILALDDFSLGFGELVTLASALLFALHIVGLGAWSTPSQALGLSVVQIGACAVVSVVAAAPGGYRLTDDAGSWAAVVYMALISGALAMFVQSGPGPPGAEPGGDHHVHRTGLGSSALGDLPGRAADLADSGGGQRRCWPPCSWWNSPRGRGANLPGPRTCPSSPDSGEPGPGARLRTAAERPRSASWWVAGNLRPARC